jgi:hypothetical protein
LVFWLLYWCSFVLTQDSRTTPCPSHCSGEMVAAVLLSFSFVLLSSDSGDSRTDIHSDGGARISGGYQGWCGSGNRAVLCGSWLWCPPLPCLISLSIFASFWGRGGLPPSATRQSPCSVTHMPFTRP